MATKGKNTSKSTNKKSNSSSTSKNSKTSSNRSQAPRTSTKSKEATNRLENMDPFFADSTKEIILWTSIAVCILLCISNIGLGGTVGGLVSGFLFGIFGLVQFILPFLLAFSAFFLISNYGNKVAIAKVIAGSLLIIDLSIFIELFLHGHELQSASEAYFNSMEKPHLGGGFIGGGLASFLTASFGIFGAYLISIIVFITNLIIIVEKFAYSKVQRSSKYRSDLAAARRRDRREREMLEREANLTRFNNNRNAIREKIEKDNEQQRLEEANTSGPRRNRKHSGITANTSITESNYINDEVEGVNEIRFNLGINEEEVEITETKRHKLTSGNKSSSIHSFMEEELANEVKAIKEEVEIEAPKTRKPVINIPKEEKTTSSSASELTSSVMDSSATVEETTRHSKASVTSKDEMDKEAKDLQAKVSADKNKPKKPYKYPPMNLLNEPKKGIGDSKDYLNEMAQKLEHTLKNFGVEAEVKEVTLGPSVTQYKISIDQGTKVSKVLNLSDDIKLNLAVTDVRIEAPIPGEPYIGIEVPNKQKTMVGFRELVASSDFKNSKSKISICVGKDIQGKVIVGNIEKMPHLLIAGATGSGKSVCINTIIMSILYHASPDDVKLIMVDPKMVELSVYNGIPHLLLPVITDAKKAAGALHWAVKEMTDRYELLAMAGVRNIESFNEKVEQDALPDSIPEDRRGKMPFLVVILDELADLMMVAAADVEDSIVRLAQLARAAGIHLIIATQRPTSNVITGLIKANVPSRIAFSVSSAIDSRVILDMNGAEDLLGNGDMMYAPQNLSKPVRVQGAFVSEEEVARVVDFLKNNNDPGDYNDKIQEAIQNTDSQSGSVQITGEVDNSLDALFAEAGKLVIESQKGSIGYLQRNFRIGFNRAARIMDQLCEKGVVGPEMGTKPREIKMSNIEFEELLKTL